MCRICMNQSCKGCHCKLSISELPSSSKCLVKQRMKKSWNRQDAIQQRACQECLKHSPKRRVLDHTDNVSINMSEEKYSCISSVAEDGNSEIQVVDEIKLADSSARSKSLLDNEEFKAKNGKCDFPWRNPSLTECGCSQNEKNYNFVGADISEGDDHACDLDSTRSNNIYNGETGTEERHYVHCSINEVNVGNSKCTSAEAPLLIMKSKRHSDGDLDNPKPSKFCRPVYDSSNLAKKHHMDSFCGTDDHLLDGFYDAGLDRPFMLLQDYELSVGIDSLEIILLDRGKDEELDAIALSARLLLSRFQRSILSSMERGVLDDLLRASILALYVSDCYGGSDRSSLVLILRKGVVGSNKLQPFICSCSGGRIKDDNQVMNPANSAGVCFNKLCENSLRAVKETLKSSVVPLAALRFGICRHKAALMKAQNTLP